MLFFCCKFYRFSHSLSARCCHRAIFSINEKRARATTWGANVYKSQSIAVTPFRGMIFSVVVAVAARLVWNNFVEISTKKLSLRCILFISNGNAVEMLHKIYEMKQRTKSYFNIICLLTTFGVTFFFHTNYNFSFPISFLFSKSVYNTFVRWMGALEAYICTTERL